MNRLPTKKRAAILEMLIEGNSMRAAARMADCSINTVTKLLRDAGNACADYHDEHVRDIEGRRSIQCDEIWSYIYAKDKNLPEAKSPPPEAGSAWTWTALDAESKMIVSWLLSVERDKESAVYFMRDLSRRLTTRPVISTDALGSYEDAIRWWFGRDTRHNVGKGTSLVERQNLTMRMSMRRFIRRTNGFSKRQDAHVYMLALYFLHYNFCRIHSTIRCSPAMAIGVEEKLRDMRWIVGLIDREPGIGTYGTAERAESQSALW